MAKPPAKTKSPKTKPLGAKGKRTTSAAAAKAATALKSVTSVKTSSPKPTSAKSRKKPGPKPGSKRGAVTATGAPRKKPGPKPGSKRGALTAAGKPRKKPGPKPTVKKSAGTKTVVKKAVGKKSLVKKPAVKKAVAKKAVAKKAVAKKAVAKKAVVKKTVIKTAGPKKAISKKVSTQKSTAKNSPAKKAKTASKPTPVAVSKKTPTRQTPSLQARIDSIQARLERSDAQTKKNISTLKKAFSTLQAKAGSDTPEISKQVSKLSQKIEAISASAHVDVSSALSEALSDPTGNNLTAAFTRAEQRLAAAETAQSASIAKVNQHIADMAIAIDARFKKEAQTNKDAITHLGERITSVETESAAAISQIGDKVIAISSEFGQRAEDNEEIIKEKVSEIALKTQQEFEQYRANLERRIEALAGEQNQARANLDTALHGLSSRVEGLEHVAGQTGKSNTPGADAQSYPAATAVEKTQASIPAALHLVDTQDAFAPDPVIDSPTEYSATAIVPPNPYTAPEPDPEIDPAEAHIPQEFDASVLRQETPAHTQIPAPVNLQVPTPVPSPELPEANSGTFEPLLPGAVPLPEALPEELSLPYGDPAYAEAPAALEPAMNQARPGDFGEDKKRLELPKFNMSPRNMKMAGLALGVVVVGMVGVKALGGKSDSNAMMAENSINRSLDNSINNAQAAIAPSNNEALVIETTAPTIGDYADNKFDGAPMGSEEALTLEAAAQAGDPIAQYQLGISYLENGRTEEAVKLIRAASDGGQPAAQYRLAKLYETGEGVTLNANMARQLTERAARSGNRIAMHDLALYHAEGRGGVKMDLDTAAKWFEKAAERGVVDSQFNLGVMYETGKGVPKNLTDAFVWYSVAAAQGDQFAKERVGVLKTQLDGALIASAETRAKKFTPSKIDQGANGIFTSLPWNTQKEAATPRTADPRIKEVQVMLMGLGFDTGGADGAIGPKTRTAIVSFQKANGLTETGLVDDTLVDRLEFASGA